MRLETELRQAEDGAQAAVSDGERLAWLALALTSGLGPRRIARMVKRVGSAESILLLPLTELEGLEIPAGAAQAIFSRESLAEAEKEWKRVEQEGARLLMPVDAEYPERLKEIYDPPVMLWVRGDVGLLRRPGIAVVGTRHPSPYGTGMAEVLSRDLAARGMVIFSGMARGIDTAAHKGALLAGGDKAKTVAVWGTGIDVIYPKENKKLAEEILAAGGALVSEYRMGTMPTPANFPVRNRILSGMSVGVLVVEAGEFSGTRVTARCALEQNRDIFAVPGNVTTKNAWGPNMLIQQGAKLTATWEDVWNELPTQIRLEMEETGHGTGLKAGAEAGLNESLAGVQASLIPEEPLPEQERLVLEALRHDEALQMDELIEALENRASSSEIFAALFELELRGLIRAMPGKNYVRTVGR